MAQLSSQYLSEIYQEFKSLRGSELAEIIRFYEENKQEIYSLELNEFFELQVSYLTALFDFSEFDRFLGLVDEAIETSIIHNIVYVDHENIFNKLLYMKGEACHFNMRYDDSIYIFEELIKIDPYKNKYFQALAKTKSKVIPQYLKNSRAIGILVFILAGIVIGFEVLVIRNFFLDKIFLVELTRNILFGSGWVILIVGELIHYWKVENYIKQKKKNFRKAKSLQ